MTAPGLIQPPEHKNHTSTILIGTVFLILAAAGCMCVGVLNTHDNVLGIGFLTTSAWGAVVILLVKFSLAREKLSGQELLREAQYHIESEEHKRKVQAAKAVEKAPETVAQGSLAVLGAPILGDLPWCFENWFTLPERDLAQHGVLIGASGSGKTVTLLRIAYLAARIYGYKVFFVDAKPSRETAARFLTLMNNLGAGTAMFPRMQYNGWNGDGNAILNRLMGIELFTEPYYKATTKRVLNAICKPQPPTSSREFLSRLDTLHLASVPGLTARDLGGVQNRYHAFFDTIEGQLDGKWSFDTVDTGYLLLDGTALKEEAASLGRYLIEDFAHYCTTRKPPQHKTLLIIDEYSALSQSGADTANLFERIRESGGAILVSGQGYASMGEDIERMLDAASFYIVHRSAAPEEITKRAGTVKNLQEMRHFGGDLNAQIYDSGRTYLEEEPAVHPDRARRLGTGQALIISHGRYSMAHIATPPAADTNQLDHTRAWINQPASQPARQSQRTQPTRPDTSPPAPTVPNPSQNRQPTAPPIQKHQSTPKQPPYTGPELL